MGLLNSLFFTERHSKTVVVVPHASRNRVSQTELSSVAVTWRRSILGIIKASTGVIPPDFDLFLIL